MNDLAPSLAGIPLLVADPKTYLFQWRQDAIAFLNALSAESRQALESAKESGLVPATQARLTLLSRALQYNHDACRELLLPLTDHELLKDLPVAIPVPTSSQNSRLASNLGNIFRDWAWEETEVSHHLQFVNAMLPSGPLGRVLILGAGSARLAFDLATECEASEIVATEINPLLFLIASRVLQNEKLGLFEIPDLPNGPFNAAKKRDLQLPGKLQKAKLTLVLNDFLSDSSRLGRFDLVITPWFIDVVGAPIDQTMETISSLLKTNGCWVNVGPLMILTNRRDTLYTAEEVHEKVSADHTGFVVKEFSRNELTQLKSELSASFRTDEVYAWRSEKLKPFEPPKTSQAPRPQTSFLTDFKAPMDLKKLLPQQDLEEAAQSHHLLASILQAAYEGKSVAQLANHLSPDFGLPADFVAPIIANLIRDYYRSQTGLTL